MKRTICLLTLLSSVAFGQTAANSKGNQDGWVTLFDGQSLSGWTPEQGAKWRAAAGVLVGDAGEDGWLRSSRQFTNFLLHIEYRDFPRGNSGVFLRATKESNLSDPSNPAGSYELQINNEDDKWATGSIENSSNG